MDGDSDTLYIGPKSVFYDIIPRWSDGSKWEDFKNTPDPYIWTQTNYLFAFQFEKYKFRNYLPQFIEKFMELNIFDKNDLYTSDIFDNIVLNVVNKTSNVERQFEIPMNFNLKLPVAKDITVSSMSTFFTEFTIDTENVNPTLALIYDISPPKFGKIEQKNKIQIK